MSEIVTTPRLTLPEECSEQMALAWEYWQNARQFINDDDPYSALLNMALAVNTLEQVKAGGAVVLQQAQACNSELWCDAAMQEEAMCSLDNTINTGLRWVAALQDQVRALRGAQVAGQPGAKAGQCGDVEDQEVPADCKNWFDTVIGLDRAKRELQNGFINPLIYPNLYTKLSKGILLYGPPGTGKTLLAKAAVNELKSQDPSLDVRFFAPKGGDMKGKYVGETEQKIENLFACASQFACQSEQQSDPKKRVLAVIFLDEVEAVAGDRSNDVSGTMTSSVNALLQAMDGITEYNNVVVMAATNFPWQLDSAFLRRFGTTILVNLPTYADIVELINQEISQLVDTCNIKRLSQVDSLCPPGRKNGEKPCLTTDRDADYYKWTRQPYSTYVPLTAADIAAVAKYCQRQHFSGSDVARMMQDAMRQAASAALSNGVFFYDNVLLGIKADPCPPSADLGFIPAVSTLCRKESLAQAQEPVFIVPEKTWQWIDDSNGDTTNDGVVTRLNIGDLTFYNRLFPSEGTRLAKELIDITNNDPDIQNVYLGGQTVDGVVRGEYVLYELQIKVLQVSDLEETDAVPRVSTMPSPTVPGATVSGATPSATVPTAKVPSATVPLATRPAEAATKPKKSTLGLQTLPRFPKTFQVQTPPPLWQRAGEFLSRTVVQPLTAALFGEEEAREEQDALETEEFMQKYFGDKQPRLDATQFKLWYDSNSETDQAVKETKQREFGQDLARLKSVNRNDRVYLYVQVQLDEQTKAYLNQARQSGSFLTRPFGYLREVLGAAWQGTEEYKRQQEALQERERAEQKRRLVELLLFPPSGQRAKMQYYYGSIGNFYRVPNNVNFDEERRLETLASLSAPAHPRALPIYSQAAHPVLEMLELREIQVDLLRPEPERTLAQLGEPVADFYLEIEELNRQEYSSMRNNIRYVNWNLTSGQLSQASFNVTSTYDAENTKDLIEYEKNPDAVLQKRRKMRRQ